MSKERQASDAEGNEVKSVKVQLQPAVAYAHSLGLYVFAEQFLKAYQCQKPERRRFSPVDYYLCCHALECGLKAFLRARGKDKEYIKKDVGHDLVRALAAAEDLCLTQLLCISNLDREVVRQVNAYYSAKEFEYLELNSMGQMFGASGLPELPRIEQVADFTGRLLRAIDEVCKKSLHQFEAVEIPCGSAKADPVGPNSA